MNYSWPLHMLFPLPGTSLSTAPRINPPPVLSALAYLVWAAFPAYPGPGLAILLWVPRARIAWHRIINSIIYIMILRGKHLFTCRSPSILWASWISGFVLFKIISTPFQRTRQKWKLQEIYILDSDKYLYHTYISRVILANLLMKTF